VGRRGLILTLFFVFMGCEFDERPTPPLRVNPPSGNGTVGVDGGVERTLFRPLGTLQYGDETSALVQPDTLLGYVFHGTAGDVPTLDLSLAGNDVVSLAVYGPQSSTGRWGDAIASAHDAARVLLTMDALPGDGAYFVLIRTLEGAGSNYVLSLSCEGCGESACAELEPCDLYCPDGRQESEDCLLCECVTTDLCAGDDECGDAQACVRGRCVDAVAACIRAQCDERRMDVCGADGTVYNNACWAQCHGVEFTPGPCACGGDDDCPNGHLCRERRCVPPDCSHCAGTVEPVCGERGRYQNGCFLDCAGDTLVHRGVCVRDRCEGDEACDDSQHCRPYRDRDVPGNSQACARDAEGDDCIRHCIDRPELPATCGSERPCGNVLEECFPVGPEAGVCVRTCRLGSMGRGNCPGRTHCAAVQWSAQEEGRGVCLPQCAACRRIDAFRCLPDLRGVEVCQSCNCDVLPEDPVCAGETRYRNACEALCDGQPRVSRCPSVMPQPPGSECDCPTEWAPLCVDGQVFANPCEARCVQDQQMVGRFSQCLEPPNVREVLRCTGDDQCQTRICGGQLCGTRAVENCDVRLSPMAACISENAACGCNGGVCGFRLTEETAQCGEPDAVGNRPQRP